MHVSFLRDHAQFHETLHTNVRLLAQSYYKYQSFTKSKEVHKKLIMKFYFRSKKSRNLRRRKFGASYMVVNNTMFGKLHYIRALQQNSLIQHKPEERVPTTH